MYLHIFYIIAGLVAFALTGLFVIGILNALNERKRIEIDLMNARLKHSAFRERENMGLVRRWE